MITREQLCALPVAQTPFIAGGVFSEPMCFEFVLAMHGAMRRHLSVLEKISGGGGPEVMEILLNQVRTWSRQLLIEETEDWLKFRPQLSALYKFAFTRSVRAYVHLFPAIQERGLRIPNLCDFLMCFLVAMYEDSSISSGQFLKLDHAKTMGIVLVRLGDVISDAITSLYFPRYISATSEFSRMEPDLNRMRTPEGAAAVCDKGGLEAPSDSFVPPLADNSLHN